MPFVFKLDEDEDDGYGSLWLRANDRIEVAGGSGGGGGGGSWLVDPSGGKPDVSKGDWNNDDDGGGPGVRNDDE